MSLLFSKLRTSVNWGWVEGPWRPESAPTLGSCACWEAHCWKAEAERLSMCSSSCPELQTTHSKPLRIRFNSGFKTGTCYMQSSHILTLSKICWPTCSSVGTLEIRSNLSGYTINRQNYLDVMFHNCTFEKICFQKSISNTILLQGSPHRKGCSIRNCPWTWWNARANLGQQKALKNFLTKRVWWTEPRFQDREDSSLRLMKIQSWRKTETCVIMIRVAQRQIQRAVFNVKVYM